MARAPITPGTHGEISITGQVRRDGKWISAEAGAKPERYRATTRYRDRDGKLTQVERYATTKGQAKAALNGALAQWDQVKSAKQVLSELTLADVAKTWLAQVARNPKLSEKTKLLYRTQYERHLDGSDLAAMLLSEANTVPALRGYLQALADRRGTATAKTLRSILSGILALAVEDSLIAVNAVRSVRHVEASTPKASERDTRRALTREERDHLLATADADQQAIALDVADLIAYMAGTGVRIGEALRQQWEDVSLDAGTVHVRGTKSQAAERDLALPDWLVARLAVRADAHGTTGLLFPSPGLADRTKVRDESNVFRVIKRVFNLAGFDWARSHTLRRTVATLIHESGLPVTAAQAQLGHADASMTMRVYLATRPEPSKATAGVL